MHFLSCIKKIQGVANDAELLASLVSDINKQKKYLISWLKNTYSQLPNPSFIQAQNAREVAIVLAKADDPEASDEKIIELACRYLESNRCDAQTQVTIQANEIETTRAHFLQGHFVKMRTAQEYRLCFPNEWIKDLSAEIATQLCTAYEMAFLERERDPFHTIEACFNLPKDQAHVWIEKRKIRLKTLMLPSDFPANMPYTQVFWKLYMKNCWEESIQPDMRKTVSMTRMVSTDMGLSSINNERADVIAVCADIITKQQASRMHLLQKELQAVETAEQKRTLLAHRKNTKTSGGYTGSPYASDNFLCARMALALIGQDSRKPREEFWQLLYPDLKGVYLGNDDSDWPDYGNALLVTNPQQELYLINYEKIALMSQHSDVKAIVLGQMQQPSSDPLIRRYLTTHPHYWALSTYDIDRIIHFNQCHQQESDAYFWTMEMNEARLKSEGFDCQTYLDFFKKFRNVLNQFSANTTEKQKYESDVGEAGKNAVKPFLIVLENTTVIHCLKNELGWRRGLFRDGQAAEILLGLKYLIELNVIYSDCFSKAVSQLDIYLNHEGIVDILKKMVFNLRYTVSWKSRRIHGSDNRLPLSEEDAQIAEIVLRTVTNKLDLFNLIEQKDRFCLSIDQIVQQFMKLSDSMSLKEIFNFITEHFPKDAMVTDLKDEKSVNAQHLFMWTLFPKGIPDKYIKNDADYVFAIKIHDDYAVDGRNVTIKKAFNRLNDRVNNNTNELVDYAKPQFDEIRQLIIALFESMSLFPDSAVVDCFKRIALPSDPFHLAIFIRLFSENELRIAMKVILSHIMSLKNKHWYFYDTFFGMFSDKESHQILLIEFLYKEIADITYAIYPHITDYAFITLKMLQSENNAYYAFDSPYMFLNAVICDASLDRFESTLRALLLIVSKSKVPFHLEIKALLSKPNRLTDFPYDDNKKKIFWRLITPTGSIFNRWLMQLNEKAWDILIVSSESAHQFTQSKSLFIQLINTIIVTKISDIILVSNLRNILKNIDDVIEVLNGIETDKIEYLILELWPCIESRFDIMQLKKSLDADKFRIVMQGLHISMENVESFDHFYSQENPMSNIQLRRDPNCDLPVCLTKASLILYLPPEHRSNAITLFFGALDVAQLEHVIGRYAILMDTPAAMDHLSAMLCWPEDDKYKEDNEKVQCIINVLFVTCYIKRGKHSGMGLMPVLQALPEKRQSQILSCFSDNDRKILSEKMVANRGAKNVVSYDYKSIQRRLPSDDKNIQRLPGSIVSRP